VHVSTIQTGYRLSVVVAAQLLIFLWLLSWLMAFLWVVAGKFFLVVLLGVCFCKVGADMLDFVFNLPVPFVCLSWCGDGWWSSVSIVELVGRVSSCGEILVVLK
jgi:hypothetical protein